MAFHPKFIVWFFVFYFLFWPLGIPHYSQDITKIFDVYKFELELGAWVRHLHSVCEVMGSIPNSSNIKLNHSWGNKGGKTLKRNPWNSWVRWRSDYLQTVKTIRRTNWVKSQTHEVQWTCVEAFFPQMHHASRKLGGPSIGKFEEMWPGLKKKFQI